jgi:hypothetical protein
MNDDQRHPPAPVILSNLPPSDDVLPSNYFSPRVPLVPSLDLPPSTPVVVASSSHHSSNLLATSSFSSMKSPTNASSIKRTASTSSTSTFRSTTTTGGGTGGAGGSFSLFPQQQQSYYAQSYNRIVTKLRDFLLEQSTNSEIHHYEIVKEIFARIDDNGSGIITSQEMITFLKLPELQLFNDNQSGAQAYNAEKFCTLLLEQIDENG